MLIPAPAMTVTPTQTVAPILEPVSLTEAKSHLNIATDDASQNDVVNGVLIQAAREQWEHDTQTVLMERTLKIDVPKLQEFQFSQRPVTSITSVKYYDLNNTQQTLSTDVYELDAADSSLRLKYNQVWPSTLERWDAVEIIFVCGKYSLASAVPMIAKQAMLLLIGRDFMDREDMVGASRFAGVGMQRYESLVRRYMRSTYP